MDWEALMEEAEELAGRLKQTGVDLDEAEKALTYYLHKNCDEKAMSRYLELMAIRPPLRSKKTQVHYRTIRSLWMTWRTDLRGADKARAWGWAVRLARV